MPCKPIDKIIYPDRVKNGPFNLKSTNALATKFDFPTKDYEKLKIDLNMCYESYNTAKALFHNSKRPAQFKKYVTKLQKKMTNLQTIIDDMDFGTHQRLYLDKSNKNSYDIDFLLEQLNYLSNAIKRELLLAPKDAGGLQQTDTSFHHIIRLLIRLFRDYSSVPCKKMFFWNRTITEYEGFLLDFIKFYLSETRICITTSDLPKFISRELNTMKKLARTGKIKNISFD